MMSSPEVEKEVEEQPVAELSSGVKVISEMSMYILTAPLNLVKEISMSLVSMRRDLLYSLMYLTYGFHGVFILWDIFVMIYNRNFDLLIGTPPLLVKLVSVFLAYILFQFILDRVFTTGNEELEKMDIAMSDTPSVVEEEVELFIPPPLPNVNSNSTTPSKTQEEDKENIFSELNDLAGISNTNPFDLGPGAGELFSFEEESIPDFIDISKPAKAIDLEKKEEASEMENDEFIRNLLYRRDD